MINGSNWTSVRLKTPVEEDSGWLVEFRTMEVQLTADENAAFSLFVHLFVRLFHESQELNLYLPITKLRENFDRAHQRNAVLTQRFHFRTNIHDEGEPQIEELTIAEILFGRGDFRGLFHEL
jgi:glutamate--cysteine ligase catalytic subunit